MTNLSLTYEVALYLRGDKLDPRHVSAMLGVEPTEAQKKGESRVTSTNKHFYTKTGLWSLVDKRDSMDLGAFIEEISEKFGDKSVAEIAGVDEAYVDIFVAKNSDEDGGGTHAFEVSQKSILALSGLGLSIRVTVAIVKE